MREPLKYQALISASTGEQAAEIAAEALSPDKRVVRAEVEDVSAEEGPDSWRVTLWFTSGRRTDPMD